MYKTKPKKTKA